MINRERGSYPWGAIAMNIELIVQQGKYNACLPPDAFPEDRDHGY
jgi:hypothetical protein